MAELTAAVYGATEWPTVSVVMPIRNEAAHLERAVTSILAQNYPVPFDICLAVAPSDDESDAIAAAIVGRESRVRLASNPAGATPSGLNAAIAATSGTVIVRVDGHAELSEGYLRRAVETMRRTGAVNVGGIQAAQGETPFEQAVAAAMTSWMGTGGSRFHVGGAEGPVDTVYLGVFDRAAGDSVGWFDESLIRNQDYELNIRLRQAGGTIWFDPQLSVSYRPRGSIRALARQYYEYGWWKAEVARQHPGSLRPRQILAAIAPVVVVASLVAAVIRPRLLVGPAVYLAAVLTAAGLAGRSRLSVVTRAILVFPTQHAAWSAGFVAAGWRSRRQRPRERNQTGPLNSSPIDRPDACSHPVPPS